VQLADYLEFLRRNLSAGLFLPALLAGLGWLWLSRREPRLALGLLVFFLCAGPGAVIYFNLPHGYFRPIDRHYLPSLVILIPWLAVGAASLIRGAGRMPGGTVIGPWLALLLGLAPFAFVGRQPQRLRSLAQSVRRNIRTRSARAAPRARRPAHQRRQRHLPALVSAASGWGEKGRDGRQSASHQ
jgi:hypothetical protein